MKNFTILLSLVISTQLLGQPVIQDGSNRPALGFATTVSVSVTATTSGTAGENQIWDYSGLTFSPMGDIAVVDPATSAYATYFPTANFCMYGEFGGTAVFTYRNYAEDKMEEMASFITAPGIGQDYSPNPATRLVFPMNYGEETVDTWQKVGDSPNTVVITYDAYGTFVSPYNTYTGVVRIANDYGSGEIDYSWFILNPLRLLAVHKHSDNTLILLDDLSVGLDQSGENRVRFYPNPVSDYLHVAIDGVGVETTEFELFDVRGVKVRETTIKHGSLNLSRGTLSAGIYFYKITAKEGATLRGKLIFD